MYNPENFKPENIELGKRLKKYRKESGIKQGEMAKYCNLSTNYISALERGVNQCNAKTLMIYAEKTGLSAEDIYYGNTNKHGIILELQEFLSSLDDKKQKKILSIIKMMSEY